MSNRRKLRNRRKVEVPNKGLAKVRKLFSTPSDREHVPTADEIFSGVETEEGVIIKTVPARHKGVDVGEAHIHDDGTVTINFSEDAPQWALDEIRATADEVGYSLEEGRPINGST